MVCVVHNDIIAEARMSHWSVCTLHNPVVTVSSELLFSKTWQVFRSWMCKSVLFLVCFQSDQRNVAQADSSWRKWQLTQGSAHMQPPKKQSTSGYGLSGTDFQPVTTGWAFAVELVSWQVLSYWCMPWEVLVQSLFLLSVERIRRRMKRRFWCKVEKQEAQGLTLLVSSWWEQKHIQVKSLDEEWNAKDEAGTGSSFKPVTANTLSPSLFSPHPLKDIFPSP